MSSSVNRQELEQLLDEYGLLLQRVDDWFAACIATQQPGRIACVTGCSECCRGLFDVTLLDAFFLKRGFDLLPSQNQQAVLDICQDRLSCIRSSWPDFGYPYILNYRPEEEWDDIMPDDDETPCPLLDSSGRCIVYGSRPMTCRLHGIPLIDTDGEVFHDEWCSKNFIDIDPMTMNELRGEFRQLFADEITLFHRFTRLLCGEAIGELDTLIPCALFLDINRL